MNSLTGGPQPPAVAGCPIFAIGWQMWGGSALLFGRPPHICAQLQAHRHPPIEQSLELTAQHDDVSNIEQTLTFALGTFADVGHCVGGLQAD
jgi:hypothetical protein